MHIECRQCSSDLCVGVSTAARRCSGFFHSLKYGHLITYPWFTLCCISYNGSLLARTLVGSAHCSKNRHKHRNSWVLLKQCLQLLDIVCFYSCIYVFLQLEWHFVICMWKHKLFFCNDCLTKVIRFQIDLGQNGYSWSIFCMLVVCLPLVVKSSWKTI